MKTQNDSSRGRHARSQLHLATFKILTLFWLVSATEARAADFNWINPGGGDWGDTNNWSPSRYFPPDYQDSVAITLAGAYTVTGNGSAGSLTLGDGVKSFPTLLLNQTAVSVTGAAYAAAGSSIVLSGGDGSSLFSGGNFSANSGLTLDGLIDWRSGILGGTVTVTTNGLIRGSTSLNHYLAATIYNHGKITWSADNITSGGSWLQNMPEGLLDFQNDGEFGTFGGNRGPNIVINNGTILKSAGTNILTLDGPYFVTNTGVVKVESGTLEFYNNVTIGGTFNVSSNAALWLESGVFNMIPGYTFTGPGFYGVPRGGSPFIYGTISDPNFQMNGRLYGTNVLSGTMNANSGDFEGATTVAGSGMLNLSGCVQCGSIFASTETGGAMTNAGTINWLSGDWYGIGGSLLNLSNGVINIKCDAILAGFNGVETLLNAGVIRKSASNGTNMLSGLTLTNLGLVDVQQGGLLFLNGFASSGAFNAAAGASVLLPSSTFYLNPGHRFTGTGFYGVPPGGSPFIYGSIPGTNFQMNGTLYGTNVLTGIMNAYNVGFEGATTIAPTAVLNIGGCLQCGSIFAATSTGGALTNAGTINWLSGDWYGIGGTLRNLSNGVINIQCDASLAGFNGVETLLNAGVIRKSAGNGTNMLSGLTLTNLGLVDVQRGAVQFQIGFGSSGVFNVAAGAAVLLQFGDFYLNPGHTFTGAGFYGVAAGGSIAIYGTITGANFQMNGRLYGTNTVTGMMASYDADIEGATTIASAGVWNVSGCTQCGSVFASTTIGGALTNAGTINWLSGDWYGIGGSLLNLPGALINIQCDNQYGAFGTDSWLNRGTIRKSAGTGANLLSGLTLANFGLVDVQSGALQLQNNYTQNGGQLNFGLASALKYGRLIFGGSATLSGTLSANLIAGYKPLYGDTFNLLSYASSSGTFATQNLPALSPGLIWVKVSDATQTSLKVSSIEPALVITPSAGGFTLSWPASADAGFGLQYATNLTPPILWLPATNSVQVVGDQKVVTIPIGGGSVYYDLRK